MLRLTDVCVSRGGRRVLANVSFQVSAGEVLVLRGPNGVGKTTLLRTIAGLLRVSSGSIQLDEMIAYSGHLDAVKSALTVTENLAFWAGIYGTKPAPEIFESFNLHALKDRRAGRLSAGQKRRLGLARLAVTDAKLWVLDEPTVSLDATSQAALETVLKHHVEQGGGVVLSSHASVDIPAKTYELAPIKFANPTVSDFDEAFL